METKQYDNIEENKEESNAYSLGRYTNIYKFVLFPSIALACTIAGFVLSFGDSEHFWEWKQQALIIRFGIPMLVCVYALLPFLFVIGRPVRWFLGILGAIAWLPTGIYFAIVMANEDSLLQMAIEDDWSPIYIKGLLAMLIALSVHGYILKNYPHHKDSETIK